MSILNTPHRPLSSQLVPNVGLNIDYILTRWLRLVDALCRC
jgi:hypothetical protein